MVILVSAMKNACFFSKTLLRCLLCLGAMWTCSEADAQFHLKANLQNLHLWRGMEVTDGMVLTTDLSVTDPSGKFTFGVWGGTNTKGSYKEFNHYVSYAVKGFKLALWDTYNFSPGASYNNQEYFNYRAHETGRFLDATLSYDFGPAFPLQFSWSTILFGRDRDKQNTQNLYSTFVYGEYAVYRRDSWKVSTGIGAAFALRPDRSRSASESAYHFYGETPGVVHLSLQAVYSLKVFERDFPITVMALWNPQSNQGYFQAGVQLFSF